MATRKYVKSSMSRNSHQVEQRSKTNLLKTSLFILTPSSLKASWLAIFVRMRKYYSRGAKGAILIESSSFCSREEKFSEVIYSHWLVETMPSYVRHYATYLTQSLRADTNAFSISKVGSNDFCSLRLNYTNSSRPISKVEAGGKLKRSRTFLITSWKSG